MLAQQILKQRIQALRLQGVLVLRAIALHVVEHLALQLKLMIYV
jgi:hypothetical protein